MRVSLAAAVFLVVGACSRDLALPETPALGGISGALDTQPSVTRVSPAGRTVTVIDARGGRTDVATDVDGGFSAPGLQPGVYTLSVKVPAFAPLIEPAVSVPAGQVTDVGVLAPYFQGAGSTDEGTLTGLVTTQAGGTPVGATVAFTLEPALDVVQVAVAGADAHFFARVPPGTYTLVATHPEFVDARLEHVAVGSGEKKDLTSTPLVMGVNPATLTGKVLGERDDGQRLPEQNVLVTVGTGATTTTDATGTFSITGLPAGTFSLRFAKTNFVDPNANREVVLHGGQTTTVPDTLLPLDRADITGTVELADRAPLDQVSISVLGTAYGAVVSADPTNPWRGSFKVPGVPFGVYSVQASRPRYTPATAQVTVGALAPASAGTLVLTPQLGDFAIDDGDSTNTPGFSRTLGVTLMLDGFPSTGVAGWRASEDPNFADAGFLAFSTKQQPFTLADADGVHTVYAQYKDATGTTSPRFQNSVVLDRVAPQTPQVVLADTGSSGQGATVVKFTKNNQVLGLSVTGLDDRSGVAGMKLSGSLAPDGGMPASAPKVAYQTSTTFSRATTADGPQPVYVQLFDNAGNASLVGQDLLVVDTQPPTGALTIARGPKATVPALTNQLTVAVTVTAGAEPDGGFVQVKLANGNGAELDAAPYGVVRADQPWPLASGADGPRTVYAVLKDTAGNTSAPISAGITLDTTPPAPGAVSASVLGGPLSSSLAVTLSVASTATDLSPTQALTVSEDYGFTAPGTVGPTALPGTGQQAFTLGAGDGLRLFYARFRDGAGNDAIVPLTVTVDTAPPSGVVEIQGLLADGTPSTTLAAQTSATVRLTTQGAASYFLGGATLTACPTAASSYLPLPATGLAPVSLSGAGTTRVVRACLRDAAGNVFGGPVAAGVSPLLWVPADAIAFDATPPSGCTAAVSGTKADGTAAPAGKTAQLAVGWTLAGCPTDAAELVATPSTVTCTSLPSTVSWQPFQSAGSLTLPSGDGPKSLSFCVRDAARNVATLLPPSITLDTTPPTGSWLVVENGDGWANKADKAARGGYATVLGVTHVGASQLVVAYAPALGMPQTALALGASPLTVNLPLSGSIDPGTQSFDAWFVDDVGNATPRVTYSVGVDTQPPVAPTLAAVDGRNRAALLSWYPLADSTVAGYGLVSALKGAALPAPPSATTVTGNVSSGLQPGLANRTEYDFAVYAYDFAGNLSALSNSLSGTVGFERHSIPYQSVAALRPLSALLVGDQVFVSFAELDYGWGAEMGNVKVAYSPDLGRTWKVSTADPEFAFARMTGHLSNTAGVTYLTTVGTNLFASDAGYYPDAQHGAPKVYATTDGETWTTLYDYSTQPGYFGDARAGAGLIPMNGFAKVIYPRYDMGANLLTASLITVPPSAPALQSTVTSYDYTDNVPMMDFRVCSSNDTAVLAWRESSVPYTPFIGGTTVRALWHRYAADLDFTPGAEGDLTTISTTGVTDVDGLELACASQLSRTNAYALLKHAPAATGGPASLVLRRRFGSAGAWAATAAAMPSDVDDKTAARLYAAQQSVFIVYRTVASTLKLGVSTDEGNTFSWSQLESDPFLGRLPVMGGQGPGDLVIASTTGDQSRLNVLVPAMRNLRAVGSTGIGSASLSWDTTGPGTYRVDLNDAGVAPWPVSTVTSSNSFAVDAGLGNAAFFHRVSAVDDQGAVTEEGDVFQLAAFKPQVTLFTSGGNPQCQQGASDTTALVAHDAKMLVLPPYGCNASIAAGPVGPNYYPVHYPTFYRSADYGQTFTAYTPSATPVTRHAMAGANGRAYYAFEYAAPSPLTGLRVRVFSDLTGTAGTEQAVDTGSTVDFLSVGADRSTTSASGFVVASANVAANTISVAYCNGLNATPCTLRTPITIPNGASYDLGQVEVWQVEGAHVVIAWKQDAGIQHALYLAESFNSGVTFGAAVLMADGLTYQPNVQTGFVLAGSANASFKVMALGTHENGTQQDPVSFLVAGTDLPTSGAHVQRFNLRRDGTTGWDIDAQATTTGHYVVYGSHTIALSEEQLSLAACFTDCQHASSWVNRALITFPSNVYAPFAPALGVSTASTGPADERLSIAYKESGATTSVIKVLRGAALKRTK